jgi:hypothetical protein
MVYPKVTTIFVSFSIQVIYAHYAHSTVSNPESVTQSHGRVVKTPTSYSEFPRLDSLPRRPAILIEVSRGFRQSLQENSGDRTLKFGHDHFLPNTF